MKAEHEIGDIIYYDDSPGTVVAVAVPFSLGRNSLDYQVFWAQTGVTTWVWGSDICSEEAYLAWLDDECDEWSRINEGEW